MASMTAVAPSTKPVTVVTADSHVGPSLSQLRPYCDRRYVDDFDEFASSPLPTFDMTNPQLTEWFGGDEAAIEEALSGWILRNAKGEGIHDIHVRLADMDSEGVAGEVVFHGTPTADGAMAAIPFSDGTSGPAPGNEWSAKDRELMAVGRQIYNRWLADFCSVAPDRHAGLCQLPIWDVDASVETVRWAAEQGLRGVNFPHPQWSLPPYEDSIWDPLFSTCAALGMPLVTHIGGGSYPPTYTGASAIAIELMETPYVSGRNLWHLIFSGAFDRHPNLTLVITEVPGSWFTGVISDMESLYADRARSGPILRRSLRHRPYDYVANNVFFGISFMSPAEALAAVEIGLVDRVMWGSDYPHPEGTWLYDADGDVQSPCLTRLSLANTFAGFDESDVRKMAGGNAIDCYGLDASALDEVAARIGPHVVDLTTAPDLSQVPSDYTGLAFRTEGAWR